MNEQTKQERLPWRCPEHPNAKILHTWDQTHWVMNGYPAGIGVRGNHRYECNECGCELAAPIEASNRGVQP